MKTGSSVDIEQERMSTLFEETKEWMKGGFIGLAPGQAEIMAMTVKHEYQKSRPWWDFRRHT